MEILIIILGIILDRVSKLWALGRLKSGSDIIISKDFFSLHYLENRGAAWGVFQNKLIFLSIITLIAIFAMIYFLYKHRPKSKLLRVSISLIIAGALGNLFDRVVYRYVVDFIFFHYKEVYYYPVFNVADMLVVAGTILLSIYIIKDEK